MSGAFGRALQERNARQGEKAMELCARIRNGFENANGLLLDQTREVDKIAQENATAAQKSDSVIFRPNKAQREIVKLVGNAEKEQFVIKADVDKKRNLRRTTSERMRSLKR